MAWLNGWSYRKSITLSRASGAVSNYQMKILVGESSGATGETVDCNSHCLTSFNDLRFTTSDGQTLLDYWIESITGTTPNQLATIWVELDSIGTSDTTFYMYYGNASASSVSSIINTFPTADDFEWGSNGSLISTSGGGVTWTSSGGAVISTAQKYGGTRSAKLPYDVTNSLIICNLTASNNNAFRFMFYKEAAVNWAYPILHGDGSKHIYLRITNGNEINYYDGTYHATSKTVTADAWNTIDVTDVDFTAGTFKVDTNDSGSPASCAMNSGGSYPNTVWIEGDGVVDGADCWMDNFIVRNYRSTGPVWGSWSDEEFGETSTIKLLSLSGTLIDGEVITSSLSIPMQSVDGSMFTPRSIAGSLSIPIQSVKGGIAVEVNTDISASLPVLGLTLQMSAIMSASMDIQMPVPELLLFSGASIVKDFPELALTISGYVGDVMKFDNYLPRFELSIHGLTEEIAAMERSFPSLLLAIEASENVSVDNEWLLPKITTNIHVTNGQTASISATLPIFETSSVAWWTGPIALNLVIPSLVASGRMTWSDFKTLVMNTRNFALTEYDNSFNYNSIAFYNGKLIMAKPAGIYEQTGSTDDGADIEWKIKTGKIDTDADNVGRIRHAWISCRVEGDLLLTVDDGDNEYEYPVPEYSLVENAVRVKIGKGIRNRYLQFKVSNVSATKAFFNHIRLFAEKFSARR